MAQQILTLSLKKPGDQVAPLTLNLAKPRRFSVELYWDSTHDLDAHALLATNDGQGAKVTSLEQILSTYNQGSLKKNPDKSFSTPDGAVTHSGDARDGTRQDVDETITIDGAKLPAGVNEVPIFVTIHPSKSAKFSQVMDAGIRIKDDTGAVLCEYRLSDQFGEFDAVQMGSLILDPNKGWQFSPAGSGFNGDFNFILSHFS